MRTLACIAAVMLLAACSNLPSLAQGLPSRYDEATQAFTRRLSSLAPPGSPEADLVAALRRQHFKVKPANHSAEFSRSKFPCAYVWLVDWKTDDAGRITQVQGLVGAICP